jgi:RNA-directed DNA polymerase
MAGTAQPNYPDGHMPVVKVRQLQNRLWAAAKQSRERRFHALYNRAWAEHGTGELVRYADDYVVLCKSRDEAEQAHRLPSELMGELGLSLHPDKTRAVDLRSGREGFDFLGCHFHARMSGKQWEQRRIVRYYLQRWPSLRSMKRARARVKALTGRSQVGMELQDVIERLNLFLRGWGNYFRTGNAATKFVSLDRYVAWRLHRLLVKKRGRNLRAARQTAGRVPGSTTRACTN